MKKRTLTLPEDMQLPTFLGMSPGKWLTIFYGIILGAGLFFLLIFPGIRNPHSRVTIDSKLPMALYLDESYLGGSPFSQDISKGTYHLRLEREFFEDLSWEQNIGSRLFGSILFEKRINLSLSPTLVNTNGFISSQYNRLSEWAMVDTFTKDYHYPPIIEETLSGLLLSANGPFIDKATEFLMQSQRQLVHQEIIEDYLNGVTLLEEAVALSGGTMPSLTWEGFPLSDIVTSSPEMQDQRIQAYVDEFNTPYPEQLFSVHTVSLDKATIQQPIESTQTMDSGFFIRIPGGTYAVGGMKPEKKSEIIHTEEVTTFYILDHEITNGEFLMFLKANPQWDLTNKSALMEQGLVDEYYLRTLESAPASHPVQYVSWYAASAYASWIDQAEPDYTIDLPSETEWEIATRIIEGDSQFTYQGLSTPNFAPNLDTTNPTLRDSNDTFNFMGNLWEWTSGSYAPLDGLVAPYGGGGNPLFQGAERVIRGGSFIDEALTIFPENRASHPPSWSTPVVGFRIVARSK